MTITMNTTSISREQPVAVGSPSDYDGSLLLGVVACLAIYVVLGAIGYVGWWMAW